MNTDNAYNGVSQTDDATPICVDCEQAEMIEGELGAGVTPQSAWPVDPSKAVI